MPQSSQPNRRTKRRRGGMFTKKFEGAPVQLTLRLDAFRKLKLVAHAKREGCEAADVVRGWINPLIDALPDEGV